MSGGAKSKTSGALEGVKEKVEELFGGGADDEGDEGDEGDDGDEQPQARRRPAKKAQKRPARSRSQR